MVWLNEFFGPIEVEGKGFEEMKVYQRHQGRIAALLKLPRQDEQTFGRDLKAMLDQRLIFSEARGSAQFNLFSKQRIAMMERRQGIEPDPRLDRQQLSEQERRGRECARKHEGLDPKGPLSQQVHP